MAAKRGGAKRSYKKVGRLSATKCYQQWYHAQLKQGLAPMADGSMKPFDNLRDSGIKRGYEAQFGR